MVSTRSQSRSRTTIGLLNLDVLKNILSRLPALSFASAACVSRSWNLVCGRVLCRPKLSSACFMNESLYVAVEGVVNKVLSEPIRPHFAIASVGSFFCVDEAHRLITAKLGSKIPIVITSGRGCFGNDASSNEFVEWRRRADANRTNRGCTIMLIMGYLPGIKVKIIQILEQTEAPGAPMIDKFIIDIWEFSTSVSGCKSPAAIMMFSDKDHEYITAALEKMDYSLSPETVIVGDCSGDFRHASGSSRNVAAFGKPGRTVALVFVVDRNKPSGIGETRFHAVLSSGMLPVGPAYKVTSVKEHLDSVEGFSSRLTIRRDGSHEDLDFNTIARQAYNELEYPIINRTYIGVIKRRKGAEKIRRWMTSLTFHDIIDYSHYVSVCGLGIRRGDTFRFYHIPASSTTVLSSIVDVTNHLRSFKQESTTGGDKLEVFGGVIFASCYQEYFLLSEPNSENSDSVPFLDNFPGGTLGGTICNTGIARGDLIPFAKEHNPGRCCTLFNHGVVNLIMSYDAKETGCD